MGVPTASTPSKKVGVHFPWPYYRASPCFSLLLLCDRGGSDGVHADGKETRSRRRTPALPCCWLRPLLWGGEAKTSNDCITLCFLFGRFCRREGKDVKWLHYLVLSFRPLLREGSQRRQMTALPCAFFSGVSVGGEAKTSNDCITLCFLFDRFWGGRTGGELAFPALQYLSVSFRPLLREGRHRRQMTALPCAFFSAVAVGGEALRRTPTVPCCFFSTVIAVRRGTVAPFKMSNCNYSEPHPMWGFWITRKLMS